MAIAGLVLSFGSGCQSHYVDPPQQRTFVEVVKIKQGEEAFFAKFGRYGTLEELGPHGANLISDKAVRGKYAGYDFRLAASDAKYSFTAAPDSQHQYSTTSYYCDQTGVVRESRGPGVATAESEQVR